MFKKIVIALFVLPVLIFGIAFLLPKESQLSRSIVIDQSPEAVFSKINNFRDSQRWSPWAQMDPDMKVIHEGSVSDGGAKMSWRSSHPEVGNGSQEIIKSVYPEHLHIQLSFEGQGDAEAFFDLKPVNEASTEVTWSFKSVHGENLLTRYLGLMLDAWIGPKYEEGLSNLKALLENEQASKANDEPTKQASNVKVVDDQGRVIENAPQANEASVE